MKTEIEQITNAWQRVDTSTLPTSLPTKSLRIIPSLYQPRRWVDSQGISDERHVKSLAKSIAQGMELDPIIVLPLTDYSVVIDGHHRLEAYKHQNEPVVPVRYFCGTPTEALLEAGRENSKDRLSVNPKEKSERAWTLALGGFGFSKRQIANSAQVSERTVGNMREVIAWYKDQGREPRDKWGWSKWEFENKTFREQSGDFDYDNVIETHADLVAQALRKRLKRIQSTDDAIVFGRAIVGYCPSQFQLTVLHELAAQTGLWASLLEEATAESEAMRNADF